MSLDDARAPAWRSSCATGVPGAAPARARLDPSAPLIRGGLLLMEEGDRPYLTRSLRVPDRVTGASAAGRRPRPAPRCARGRSLGRCALPEGDAVAPCARASGVIAFYLRERFGSAGTAMAVAALSADGATPIVLDSHRMSPADDAAEIAAVAARECRLTRLALVVGPVEVLAERGGSAVRAFAEVACPVALVGSRPWDPAWSRGVPVVIDGPMPSIEDRARVWTEALGPIDGDVDPAASMIQFRLSPEQTVRAAKAASQQAAAEGRGALRRRPQGRCPLPERGGPGAALTTRAAARERGTTWCCPDEIAEQLHELASRARFRDVVLDTWGMGTHLHQGSRPDRPLRG